MMSAVVAAAKTKTKARKGGLGGPPAKRQRIQQHVQQGDEGEAPPEAALSFLKALNQQAKPGNSSSTGSSSITPPPPPLHGAGGKGSSKGSKSKGKTSTAFPGAKAGRSQPQPVAGRSRPRKRSSSGAGDDDAAGAVRTPSQRNRGRTSTAASTSAGASSSSSQRRILEVGEDCLVEWKTDGNKYAAIIKDVEHVEEGDDAGGVVYEVEFDNGEIERVMANDVLSQSDLEGDEGEDE